MSSVSPAGRIWVALGFVLGLVFLLGGLWVATRPKLITTVDAVWFLPPPPPAASELPAGDENEASSMGTEAGDSAEIAPPLEDGAASSGAAEPRESAEVNAAREALAESEAELQAFLDRMQAAREAIEEAVVMVREQKENFDYAFERFETLMPLVETGALEPLAASQIQSAYISARASLAQAKFFLGQARREFGSDAMRRRIHARLQRQIEIAQTQLESLRAAQTPPEALVASPGENPSDSPVGDQKSHGEIEAVFLMSEADVEMLSEGMDAIVYSAAGAESDMPVSAKISSVLEATPLAGSRWVSVRIVLHPGVPPAWPPGDRTAIPCRVVIPPR